MVSHNAEDILYCPNCNTELDLVPNTEISNHEQNFRYIVPVCRSCKKNILLDKAKLTKD